MPLPDSVICIVEMIGVEQASSVDRLMSDAAEEGWAVNA
jgi:hypothetical protein